MNHLSHSRGIKMIEIRHGRRVHLDDIATAAEGQAILDEVEAGILCIQDQLAHGRDDGPNWRRRAEFALKAKKLQRPRLQERISDLKAAEREAERLRPKPGPGHAVRDARRKAFINAAEELLGHDLFTEIWSRAEALRPQLFANLDEGEP